MYPARYSGRPLTFEEFVERLKREHNCEILSCDGSHLIRHSDKGGERFCAMMSYDPNAIIDAQLLQTICRRLNINSGRFGVPEIL